MNSWITDADLAGLALLVIALALTAVSAFAERSAARARASLLRALRWPGAAQTRAPVPDPADSGPAPAPVRPRPAPQASWRSATGSAAGPWPARAGQPVPLQRQPGWQSRPGVAGSVEDRVSGPAALQLEEAISAGDQ